MTDGMDRLLIRIATHERLRGIH